MKKIISLFLLFLVITLIGGQLFAQDYKVIVNKSNSVSSMTKQEISKLFLKKVKKFANGKMVIPVDLIDSSLLRKKFSQDIHNKNIAEINAYWQKQIFSGQGVPPKKRVSDSEVVNFVKGLPGAIGYVSASTKVDDVKVLKITGE